MGYVLSAYIQMKNKEKWEVLPLKYNDDYVFVHWCGWDCPMADIIKDIATYIPKSEAVEIGKEIFKDFEEDDDDISFRATSFANVKCTMYEFKEHYDKLFAQKKEYDDEGDFDTPIELTEKIDALTKLVNRVEAAIEFADLYYDNRDDIRVIFYESY